MGFHLKVLLKMGIEKIGRKLKHGQQIGRFWVFFVVVLELFSMIFLLCSTSAFDMGDV